MVRRGVRCDGGGWRTVRCRRRRRARRRGCPQTAVSVGRGGCGICGVHARVCSMRSSARSAACFQLVFVKI